jgi:hypothetical protein
LSALKCICRDKKALTAFVKSLLNGSAATVTSIGRGINNKAFEKHRIKRADRLLSNTNLLHETPSSGLGMNKTKVLKSNVLQY